MLTHTQPPPDAQHDAQRQHSPSRLDSFREKMRALPAIPQPRAPTEEELAQTRLLIETIDRVVKEKRPRPKLLSPKNNQPLLPSEHNRRREALQAARKHTDNEGRQP